MSGSMDATADQTHAMMQDIADHWGLAVVMGVASVILGLLAMFYPGATIVTVAIFFAAWLFVSGFVEVITSFTRDGDTGSRVLHAIIGVLSVIVGFALLRTPFQSVEVFIFVLGIFWLAQGIMTFIAAFAQKQGRNWRIFMGLLGILAGIDHPDLPDLVGRDARLHRRHLAGRARDRAGLRRVPAPERSQSLTTVGGPDRPAPGLSCRRSVTLSGQLFSDFGSPCWCGALGPGLFHG